MLTFLKKPFWPKILKYLAYSLMFFLVEYIATFRVLDKINIQHYWMMIPIVLVIGLLFVRKFISRIDLSISFLSVVSLLSLMLMFLNTNINLLNVWLSQNFEVTAFVCVGIFCIYIIVDGNIKHEISPTQQNETTNKLFNLFYINTSKVHEIVMLIDNKIMKTIEREQVSEELLKYNNSFSIGNPNMWSAESGHSKEDSSKKRVYENFDVKTTKSIMLRKIYDTTQISKNTQVKLNLGDVTIFENIELQQRNIDDTVMILNILQDSKIKNDSNDSLEVNLNKMMDKMLDDFTIDYIFSCSKQGEDNNYIIQLPYKSTDNFENGYQHNDLQLGKLSLIGIYRGEINFSKKDSTSSKFLELIAKSYNNETQQNTNPVMKASNNIVKQADNPFEFNHQKLKETLHLIDVIAIIQELNIDKEE